MYSIDFSEPVSSCNKMSHTGVPTMPTFATEETSVSLASISSAAATAGGGSAASAAVSHNPVCHSGACTPSHDFNLGLKVTCTICTGNSECLACEYGLYFLQEEWKEQVCQQRLAAFGGGGGASHSSECECGHSDFCKNPTKILQTLAALPPGERIKYTGIPVSVMQLFRDKVYFKGPPEEYADDGKAAYSCCCLTCVAAAITTSGPCHSGACTPSHDLTLGLKVTCTICTADGECEACEYGLQEAWEQRLADEAESERFWQEELRTCKRRRKQRKQKMAAGAAAAAAAGGAAAAAAAADTTPVVPPPALPLSTYVPGAGPVHLYSELPSHMAFLQVYPPATRRPHPLPLPPTSQ